MNLSSVLLVAAPASDPTENGLNRVNLNGPKNFIITQISPSLTSMNAL